MPWVLMAALFALAVVPYLPAINGEYLWDDDSWLVNNTAVHAWNGLGRIWDPRMQTLHYYPMTFTVLWAEHKLWGLNSIGYHSVNLFTHGMGAVLLYLCLRRLKLRAAWLGAALWAVHPVQAESVAWVAEIKNTLSGMFFFLAAWAYLRFELVEERERGEGRDVPRWGFYGIALGAFVLALLSKTVTVVLPAVMLIVLWGKRGKVSMRSVLYTLPLFAVGLAIAMFTAHQERTVIQMGGADDFAFSGLQRVIISGKDVWFYVRTLIFPYPLMAVYPRWNYSAGDLLNYVPTAGCVGFGAVLFAMRGRITRWPVAGLAMFVVMALPALGFVNFFTMKYTFVADHYQYLACAALLVPAAEAAARWLSRKALVAAGAAAIVVLVSLTLFYSSLWSSNMKMWTWNVEKNPNAYIAENNLGSNYMSMGNPREGAAHILRALQLAPDDDTVLLSAGRVALMEGRPDTAIAIFERALALRPGLGFAYVLLGDTYYKMHQVDKALEIYRRGTAMSHDEPLLYMRYAHALRDVGRAEEAKNAYETAIGLMPENPIIREEYANLLLDVNRPAEAIQQYEVILQTQGSSYEIWNEMAFAQVMNNMPEQAARSFETALKLSPRNEVIRYNYASLLLRMGRYDAAVAMDQAIVEANPKSERGWRQLAEGYEKMNRPEDAAAALKRAEGK